MQELSYSLINNSEYDQHVKSPLDLKKCSKPFSIIKKWKFSLKLTFYFKIDMKFL